MPAADLHTAVMRLAGRQQEFADVLARWGPPSPFYRPPGFATLVHIILEQQVSLASARAAFERLVAAVGGPVTPADFLRFDDPALKGFGFSRQKSRYGRLLAEAALAGRLDLADLESLDDEAARAALTAITGIGPWTADVYLLMALRRPDVWPAGDLALQAAAQALFDLPARPTPAELTALAEPWRPYRSAAAHLLWHAYLSDKK